MLSALILTGLLAQGDAQRFANETVSTRLRTVLPNGATILVERIPKAERVAVSLVAAARGVQETEASHGWRHLLEHLLALGKGGDVDLRLEPRGGKLNAFTSRTSMAFTVSTPRADWQRALACALEPIRPDALDQEKLARQIPILEQELALLGDDRQLGMAAWRVAYGERGLDPAGTVESMAKATAEDLQSVQKRHFAARNLVLSICGDVDLDEATRTAVRYVSQLADLPAEPWAPMPEAKPGRAEAPARGDARAAAVPAIGNPKTLWVLAAALGVASGYDDSFVAYTPSPLPGLVVAGQTKDRAGMNLALQDADPGRYFALGKRLLKRWLAYQTRTPEASAEFRAMLHLADTRIETLEEQTRMMTFANFQSGLKAFAKESAVAVVGNR